MRPIERTVLKTWATIVEIQSDPGKFFDEVRQANEKLEANIAENKRLIDESMGLAEREAKLTVDQQRLAGEQQAAQTFAAELSRRDEEQARKENELAGREAQLAQRESELRASEAQLAKHRARLKEALSE